MGNTPSEEAVLLQLLACEKLKFIEDSGNNRSWYDMPQNGQLERDIRCPGRSNF